MPNTCPYNIGDIVVFDSPQRQEIYIAQIDERHIKYWGTKLIPEISNATIQQKRMWYESGEKEIIIKKYGDRPRGMSATLRLDDL